MQRILIADDDRTSRRVLKLLLSKWDYEVVVAEDGEQAWERLQAADAPRLVILDWQMPGLDGIEVVDRLRRADPDRSTYVVFVTTRDDKWDLVEALRAGADDYIKKPFDADELRARVEVGRRFVELRTVLADRMTQLQHAMDHVKKLQGILPVCMYCHKIRTDKESWQAIDRYLQVNTDADISHTLCPDCLEERYPESLDDDESDQTK